MDPYAEDEEGGESAFGLIVPLLGGVVVLLVGVLGYFALEGPPDVAEMLPDPPAASAPKKKRRRYSADWSPTSGGGFTAPRFGGLITYPSFGSLRSEGDWRGREGEYMSKGAEGMWRLAHLYKSSRCPFQDEQTALMYLQDAANAGWSVAHYDLGSAYEDGSWGLHKDPGQALYHYRQAAELGLSNARSKVEKLEAGGS